MSASGRTCVSDFILFRERIKLVIVLFQGEISVASYIFFSVALSLFTDKINEHIYFKLINWLIVLKTFLFHDNKQRHFVNCFIEYWCQNEQFKAFLSRYLSAYCLGYLENGNLYCPLTPEVAVKKLQKKVAYTIAVLFDIPGRLEGGTPALLHVVILTTGNRCLRRPRFRISRFFNFSGGSAFGVSVIAVLWE